MEFVVLVGKQDGNIKKVIEEGMGKNVGEGNIIRFWEDCWLDCGKFMELYLCFYFVFL